MNRLITSLVQLYAQMVSSTLSQTERITFDQVASATHCPEKLVRLIIREMMSRHVLEARFRDWAFTEVHLVVFEALDELKWPDGMFGVKTDWLRSLEYRLVAVAATRTQEVYWPEAYGRASA